jgi:hypothetical protein
MKGKDQLESVILLENDIKIELKRNRMRRNGFDTSQDRHVNTVMNLQAE